MYKAVYFIFIVILLKIISSVSLAHERPKICSSFLELTAPQLKISSTKPIYPIEDHELLPYTIDLLNLPLDNVFLGRNMSNPIKPFVWLIKKPGGQIVGALFGTSHKYVSLNMFDPKIFDILSKADKVFLEHSATSGGEIFSKLERLNSPEIKTFLSPESLNKISHDEIEFLNLRQSAENISGPLYYPLTQIIPHFKSPYGLKKALYQFSEAATSELATQPVSLDSQIERYTQSLGARLAYLEAAHEYAAQFAGADTEASLEEMILKPGNIFIKNYTSLRNFLIEYRERDLKAFEAEVSQMDSRERDLTLVLRNRRWTPKIVESLKVNKFTLVVSGVFHHFGPENLIELLRPFGYEVELIEP